MAVRRTIATGGCLCVLALSTVAGASESPAAPPAATQPTGDGRYDRIAEIVANAIDQKHGGNQFRTHAAAQCELSMAIGDVKFEGRLTFQINGQSVRLDLTDGSAAGYDGQRCWTAPAGEAGATAAACQRLQTLRRLIAAPFMSRLAGTRLSKYRAASVVGANADGWLAQWTIDPDARSVAVIAYADARTHRLIALGGDTLDEALGVPHPADAGLSVTYGDLAEVEGTLLPQTMTIYDWTEAAGPRGEALGTIKATQFRFVRGDAVSFEAPAPATRPSSSGANP